MAEKRPHSEEPILVFTDGSAVPNPGPGGWGVFIQKGEFEKKLWGNCPMTTNNQMELTAPIRALEYLREQHLEGPIHFSTDSCYVKFGITQWIHKWKNNGWKTLAGPVKNQELWMQLDSLMTDLHVSWEWVKGHAGIEGNEVADTLASLRYSDKDEIEDKKAIIECILSKLNYPSEERRALLAEKGYCGECLRTKKYCQGHE